jgi:hypothetical protein
LRARNRTTTRGSDQQVLDGVHKDLQSVAVMYFASKTFTPATLEDYIQARIDAATTIVVAKAAWQKAILDYEGLDGETEIVLRDLKRFVIGMFGDDSPKLADFGYTPPKQVVWTEEKKATAVAKRAATRAARHTRGAKAKLAITGATPEGK